MLVWDNQQVTKSWFVGILEGEGCFQFKKGTAYVCISNTNTDIIGACELYLKSNNILCSIYTQKRPTKKREYNLIVAERKRAAFNLPKLLYELIEDKMECRKNEFQRILGTSETTCDLSADLDWLVGIFEAEGSFSVVMNNRNVLAFKIDICNTNYKILQKVANTLYKFGCSWYVESKTRQPNWKAAEAITLCGMTKCRQFLKLTQNKWVADRNKRRTALMLELIESRFSRNRKETYCEREVQIVQAMRDLNMKGG